MNAQIKKGILEMCVLFLISRSDMYGYDLIKLMRRHFPEVNESTFYSILRRLGGEGACECYFGEESGGPRRKYYRITEPGRVSLSKSLDDWRQINAIIKEIGIEG